MLDINTFDETKIDWKPLPDPDGEPTEHVSMSFLNVDEKAKIIDILFKFSANEKIPMHIHTSNYSTFTVKGELKTYLPSGELKDVRAAGVFNFWLDLGKNSDWSRLFFGPLGLRSVRPWEFSVYDLLDTSVFGRTYFHSGIFGPFAA